MQKTLNDVEKNGIGILGMGVSSMAVLRHLTTVLPGIGKRIPLFVRDRNSALASPLPKADYPLLTCYFGENWLQDLKETVLFRSPVIRHDLPPLQEAVARGAILTSETAWTNRECRAKCFSVTGSDGKTSTVSMLYEILSLAGKDKGFSAYLGGNIGKPLLEQASEMSENDMAVFELSSFQLLDTFPKSEVATVLNISQNHLDVHTSFLEYVTAKTHIFQNAKRKVIQADCPYTLDFLEQGDALSADTLPLSALENRFGNRPFVWLDGDVVCYTEGHATARILRQGDLQVRGKHQLRNAMTAVAMLYPYVEENYIKEGLSRFRGVEHRLQKVATLHGITCYDSSIDTSPARVEATLSALTGKPTVICGGSDKGLDYKPLADTLLRYAGRVVVTGATAPSILAALNEAVRNTQTALPIYRQNLFADAVRIAVDVTPKGEALVLSPGCASFDQFANYKAKSHAFLDILQSMGAVLIL